MPAGRIHLHPGTTQPASNLCRRSMVSRCVVMGQPGYYARPPPEYGQPVLGQPQVVGYVDAKEHYNAACVGTAFCGCWGCFATSCFCNTIPGKLGAATGCIIQSAVWTVVYATLLCIVLATVVDCNTDMTSANTSRAACEDIGTYEDDVCTFRRCPPDYTLVHGETPQAAYCKNEDHNSCFLNMDALSLGVRLAIYVICIVVSVYMRRVYQKQMRTIGNPTAVVQHSYHPLQTELIPGPPGNQPPHRNSQSAAPPAALV
ncbi:hypothetical protein DIPPA_34327 [Diplonema papillatum]|nr:hypothetical protein DIPPA_34327 [Diplonema papillatum]